MIDIGERLKKLRKSRALSQRELAKMAGINNGTIAAIEKNTVSPSVSSLKKLLDAISISLSDFFAMEMEASEPGVFFSADNMINVGSGGVIRRIMGHHDPEQKLLLIDETFPEGSDTGAKISHEGEETGLVMTGEIEVTVGEEVRILQAGDGFHFNSHTPHRFRNTSSEPCRIVCCSTPAEF